LIKIKEGVSLFLIWLLITDTSSLETKIDKMVYELYQLTPDEIAIVEGNKQV
jgi:hypothetical protein